MNNDFSEYIVYVDESGDHCLTKNDPEYPIFVLVFCVFQKNEYTQRVSPAMQKIKFKYFGHDSIVLHEHAIKKQKAPFVFLQKKEMRSAFMHDVNHLMSSIPITIIATVINKEKHAERYKNPENPYSLSLLFCMERLQIFLKEKSQNKKPTHLIFERRGNKEDKNLEAAFHGIKNLPNMVTPLEIVFADKKANLSGLQVADLVARPIGIKQLRPEQKNRAYDIIEANLYKSISGKVQGYGLKCFP
ncbi:MAG: DUF3800 domain-containing protein [Candidatus Kaiserbacteria bacterium]|nr:DUF3800 domain-containing protein [Candidatus Kaiserbacteria bacterium]